MGCELSIFDSYCSSTLGASPRVSACGSTGGSTVASIPRAESNRGILRSEAMSTSGLADVQGVVDVDELVTLINQVKEQCDATRREVWEEIQGTLQRLRMKMELHGQISSDQSNEFAKGTCDLINAACLLALRPRTYAVAVGCLTIAYNGVLMAHNLSNDLSVEPEEWQNVKDIFFNSLEALQTLPTNLKRSCVGKEGIEASGGGQQL